jgi:delta1-piperideine-2-carboxylate reductase
MRLTIADGEKLVNDSLQVLGYNLRDAGKITHHLIDSELRGYGVAGLARVLSIQERLANQPPQSEFSLTKDSASTAQLEGNDALGYLVGLRATEIAIQKAKKTGVGVVGASNTWYTGMLSYYAEMAAAQDLVTIIASNATPWVAPEGGARPILGTNPFCAGFPSTNGPPVIYDIGTSNIIHADVKLAQRLGRNLPEGAAINAMGEPTITPQDVWAGALTVWGGHKGTGLSIVVQLLGALAGSSALPPDLKDFGFFIMAVDPAMFRPMEDFKNEVDEFAKKMHECPPLPGANQLRMPFERSNGKRQATRASGVIEVEPEIVEKLRALAERMGHQQAPETTMSLSNGFNPHQQHASVGLVRLAARRLHTIATTPLTRALKAKASLTILDYLGAVASGLSQPWASSILRYAQGTRSAPQSSSSFALFVDTEKTAFLLAALAHSAIRDDMHLPSNSHIGSIAISAALSLAHRDKWSGEQLLRAVVGAYEMSALLGTAIQQSESHNKYFRPSGLCGAFGAAGAAVTASIMTQASVDSERQEDVAVSALCFAANMASGFNQWAWTGGMEIFTEMGTAASAGITAFDLSNAGMRCSEDVLEGKAGCFAALGVQGKADVIFREWVEDAGVGRGIMEVTLKPVPGCNYAQTPVAVALKVADSLKRLGLDGPEIEAVTVMTTRAAKSYPGCDNKGPFKTMQQTKMSIQFGVCAVLLQGSVSEALFARFEDEEITKLTHKCDLKALPEFDEEFKEGRQPARVEVRFKDGSSITEELANVPWLERDAVVERFRKETKETLLSEHDVKKVESMLTDLQGLTDVGHVLKLFRMQI